MPDARRGTWLAAAVAALLSALAGFGGIAAVVGGWLAQPAFALAVRGWRGATAPDWRRDALALLLLWGIGLLGLALLLAWPLASLRESGGLGAALACSVVAGLVLIGLWRLWPLWHRLE